MQARSRLYGRRIRGDVGPINLDPATNLPGRIMAPCVSLDGYDQHYDEACDDPHFTIGSRMQVGGRTFYYASAGGTLNCDVGAKNALPQHVGFANLPTALTPAASRTIIVTVGAGDGVEGDGVIGLDELFGGYIVIFMADGESINRQIVGNTIVDGPNPMTVTMDRPLGRDVVGMVDAVEGEHAECMASPYRLVQTLGAGDPRLAISSVMGMPPVPAEEGQWLWLQTWGPVWIAPQGGVSVGTNNRRVYFRADGSIDEDIPGDPNVAQGQLAGFVLVNAQAGGQGAAFIQLQIAP